MIIKHKNKLSGFIEYSLMIPWLLPNVLIALGMILTFNQPRWFMINRVLTGTTAITFVYTVLMMVVSGIVLYVVYGRGTKKLQE